MSGTTQFALFEPAIPAEPTGATEPKKFIPEVFSPQKLAYLVDKIIRPFQIPTYTLMGTADLKLALQQMRLSVAGDEVLILIRPFIHSMPIYMRVLANKTIICFIGDSQAWQWRFYPTRNIASLLCVRFGDNIKIYLSNTPFQSQGYQLGCGAFSLEMLRYFAQHGEQFIQDLLQSNCVELSSALSEPPQQVKLLAPNALPSHFVQAMKTAFGVAADYSEHSFPLPNINKKMQDYSIAPISEIMDYEQLRHLQFFATHPEQIGIETPLVFGDSMWIEEISYSSKTSAGSDSVNHLNASDNTQLKAKPTPAYRLNYRFETKTEFLYEMNLVFCPARYPIQVSVEQLRGFMDRNFTIDPNSLCFSITADSLAALGLKLNQCDTATHLQVLAQQGLTQFTAFRRFIAEAKEVVELYKIKRENNLGGLGLDCINRALRYLLATKNTIFVPTELFNDTDLDHLQGFIINNNRYEYVVFSFAVNGIHQIAVIVDCKQKQMQLIDSEGHDYSELLKQKFHRMINFTVRSTPPSSQQRYPWSCGIHVILNVLNQLQLLNKSFIDTSDFDHILRIVLRAAEHIAYERSLLSEKLQQQQHFAGCLLSHITHRQDHVDFKPLANTLVTYLESRTQQPLMSCAEQLKFECQQHAVVTIKKRSPETQEETIAAAVKAARVSPQEEMTIVASDASATTITMAETVASDATAIASQAASGERIAAVANSATSSRATRSRLADLLEIVSGITEIIGFTTPAQRDRIITNILANLPTTHDYDLSYQVVYGKNRDLHYEIDGYWGASLELLLKNGASASYVLSRVIIEILLSEDWVKRLEAEFNQPIFMGVLADELSIVKVLKDYQSLDYFKEPETLGSRAKNIISLTAKFIIFKLMHRMVANLTNYKCTVENSSTHLLVMDRDQQLYYEENLHKYFLAQFHDQLAQEQTVLLDLTPYQPLIELLCRPGGRSIAFKFDALRWKTEVFGRLFLDLTWLEYAVFENIAANVNLLIALPLSLQWLAGFLKAGRIQQAEQYFEKNKSVIVQDLSRITAVELFLLITIMPISMRCIYLLKIDSVLDEQHPIKESLRRLQVLYNNPQPESSADANLANFFVTEVKSLAIVHLVISMCSLSVRSFYFESLKQFVTNYNELKDIIVLFDPGHRLTVTRMMSHISMSAQEAIRFQENMPNTLEFLLSYIDDMTVHPVQSIMMLEFVRHSEPIIVEQRIKQHILSIVQHLIVVHERIMLMYVRLLEFIINYKKVLIEGIIQHYNSLHDLNFDHALKLIAVWSRDQSITGDDAEVVCQLALKCRALYETQDQVMQVLSTLPDVTKYRFFEEMHTQITNIDTVMKLLLLLPMEHRLAAACKMQHLVTHQQEMDLILSTLDENNKVLFIRAMSTVSCVQRPRLSLAVLLQLENKIPEEAEGYVVNNVAVLLRAIIQEKLTVEKTKILVKYRTLLIEGLLTHADNIAELTEEHIIAFIYTWFPKVTSGDKDADAKETAVIEKLALKMRRLICTPVILGIVLRCLPEMRRSYYIEQLRAFNVDASLPPPNMPDPQLSTAQHAKCHIGRVRMRHSDNAELMVYLPVTEILAFVRSNQSTITAFEDLDYYLCKLKLIEKTSFVRDQLVLEFLHLVSTFDDFGRLSHRLADQGIKKIISLLGTHDLQSADIANILQILCHIRFSNSDSCQFEVLKEYMADLFDSFPLHLRLKFSRTVTHNMRSVRYGKDYYLSHLMTSAGETPYEKLQELIDKYLQTMKTEQAYSQYVFFGSIIALIEPYKQTVESFTAPLDVNTSAFFQEVTPTETLPTYSHKCDDQSIIQKTLPLLNAVRNQDALNDPISTDSIQQHFKNCLLISLRNNSCERQSTSMRLVRVTG